MTTEQAGIHNNAIWGQIAPASPALNSHLVIRRQIYADRLWYLLHNPISERHFRISPAAYRLIERFNGKRSLDEIWQQAQTELPDSPTLDEFIQLLMQLQRTDAIQKSAGSIPLKLLEQQQKPRKWLQQLRNPLSLRLPLWDPDKMLDRLLPWVQPIIGRWGAILWLLLLLTGLIQAALHWQEITHNISSQLLTGDNLIIAGLAYILMKALHELSHGIATKQWGGEVHQVGVLFLALIPMPYVDASASAGFAEKRARMAVSAAGIMTELALATMALWLWLATAPGTINSLAYNMMLIGAVSTLLMNGNPLLKFDGYYLFSDLLDIPNLSSRANRYLGYLVQHHLFDLSNTVSPANSRRERGWFIFYGIAAFCYRIFILLAIALFVAESYPLVGKLIAIWALVGMLLLPLLKQLQFLLTSKRVTAHRLRVWSISTGIIAITGSLLFLLPLPHSTLAEGVIMPPDGSEIRAGAEGSVTSILVAADTQVQNNQPLIKLDDPFLHSRIIQLKGHLKELRLQHNALRAQHKQVQAEILLDEMALAKADLARKESAAAQLTIRSPGNGHIYLSQPADLPGRYLQQGALLGYIIKKHMAVIRVAVPQQDIGLVRQSTIGVAARSVARPTHTMSVRLERDIPESQPRLPSPILSTQGGGQFPLHPEDKDGTRPLEPIFELVLYPETPITELGERVIVRFDHGTEPLGWQWYRSLRQLFLKRLSI